MPKLEPIAITLVDLMGGRARCSHCNQLSSITTLQHTCGVSVFGVAINAEYAADPTAREVRIVIARMWQGMVFAGVGRIVPADNSGWRFESVKSPTELR